MTETAIPEPLQVLQQLVGRWHGESSGRFGPAQVEKVAEFVLGGRFLQVTSRSVSDAEIHEDIGLFSYDEATDALILREFHSEGYVNTYRLAESGEGVFVFETEAIENSFHPTLRAQLSIGLGDRLTESLALATDDKPFEVCVVAQLDRA